MTLIRNYIPSFDNLRTNTLNLIIMKVYKTEEIKNIALIGSSGSGKATLAESMLYEAGLIKRRGTIEARIWLFCISYSLSC